MFFQPSDVGLLEVDQVAEGPDLSAVSVAAENEPNAVTGGFFHDPGLVGQEDNGPGGVSVLQSLPEVGAVARRDPPTIVIVDSGQVK